MYSRFSVMFISSPGLKCSGVLGVYSLALLYFPMGRSSDSSRMKALWEMMAFLAALAGGVPAMTNQEFVLKCLLVMHLGQQLQQLPHLLLFRLTSLCHLQDLPASPPCNYPLVSDHLCRFFLLPELTSLSQHAKSCTSLRSSGGLREPDSEESFPSQGPPRRVSRRALD